MDFDVVIVGGGPAGLAAAGWLGRYRRATCLFDGGDHRNDRVEAVHGYLGSDPVSPEELRRRAHRDLARYRHLELREGRVDEVVRPSSDRLLVRSGREEVECRRLVLATGVRDSLPRVQGLVELFGADVFHCPTCDGFEARGERVAVFGWGAHVAAFAVELLDWAEDVTIVTDGRALRAGDAVRARLAEHGVEVVEDRAVEMIGRRGDLRGVRLAGGGRVDCTLAFFSIAHHPSNRLAVGLGCRIDHDGYVVVDEHGQTSVEGVYAAGDLTPGMQLVPLAVAGGTRAGVSCALSLRGTPPLAGAPTPAPDPEAVLHGRSGEG